MTGNGRISGLLKKLNKYKYTGLVLLLGVILMLIPQKNEKKSEPAVVSEPSESEQRELPLEEKIASILEKMDGVGQVDVLLSFETGPSYQYQTDSRFRQQDNSEETETETVLVTDDTKGEKPITVYTRYPTYQGALIICQGADSASIRLQITQAVADLTGLGSDKISVIKMKDN